MTANLLADPRDRTRACLPAIGHEAIDLLKPDARNPKKHSKRQIGQIARSIQTFGFNVPILVDAELRVIAGHGRLMAARQLGLARVPTIRLEHLSPEQAKAFAIADNRLTEIGTWDDRLLGEQLRELSEVDLDFSLDVTGFDIPKIDLLIEGVAAEPDTADAVPSPRPGLAVSRPGDLWQLGPHRLYCGSAIEESAYQALMGDERAVAVFTDPPYNVPIAGHASGLGAIQHREFAMAAGEMDESAFTAFLLQTFELLAQYSCDGSLHYVCMDWRHAGELLAAAKRVYAEQKNLCVCGPRTMPAWVPFTAASTSWCLCSSTAARRTAIMSSSASTGAIAAICGATPAPARCRASAMRVISWPCTRP